MRLFGMEFKNKLSRRNFITLSSLGMVFEINDAAYKTKAKRSQSIDNLINQTLSRDSDPVKNRIIHLQPRNNVAVVLEDLSEGTAVSIGNLAFNLSGFIASKHKFNLSDIAVGETIYLYGIIVGTAVKPIAKGTAVTTGNTVNAISEIQKNTPRNFKWTPSVVRAFNNKSFMRYHRPDGQVGTSKYWLVIPMGFCENRNVEVIKEAQISELGYQQVSPYNKFIKELISLYQERASSNEISKINQTKIQTSTCKTKLFENVTGIQFLTHGGGCGETRQNSEELCGLLAGYITHPNVAGATVLSLGCQNPQLSILQKEIKKRDANFSKPYFEFEQQKIGTEEEMIRQAIQSIFNGLIKADQIERKQHVEQADQGCDSDFLKGGSDSLVLRDFH